MTKKSYFVDLIQKGLALSNTLIVVVAARITDWIEKGEIPEGYFNPGGRFSRVIVLSLVKDSPSKFAITHLCGASRSEFHSIGLISPFGIIRTAGFDPHLVEHFLSRNWYFKQSQGERFSVRAYGDAISGVVAVLIARRLGCRSLASIHTTTEQFSLWPLKGSLKLQLLGYLESKARRFTHRFIDVLTPVYSPAIKGIAAAYHYKTVVVPNAIKLPANSVKHSYSCTKLLHLITVGRLIEGKTIAPLIDMLDGRPEWQLTVIGNGPARDQLTKIIGDKGLAGQVSMIPRLDNAELLKSLKKYDVFVAHTKFEEIPKTVIEAGLAGLPIMLNLPSLPLPKEYEGAPIEWVDMQTSDYQRSLDRLLDRDLKTIGLQTRQHFEVIFDPDVAGKRMADLLLTDSTPSTAAKVEL
ncbi:glycosyltransferase [Thalassospira tepidiphila]|uniref:glycosyltransferase n=1 Tax=Thalassospira tepidiphila TaxID=393657 RepID=UPI0030C67F6A